MHFYWVTVYIVFVPYGNSYQHKLATWMNTAQFPNGHMLKILNLIIICMLHMIKDSHTQWSQL